MQIKTQFQIRKSDERVQADRGWLKSKHTFSFADYHDPKYMGFSVLRVINEDFIIGGAGFDTHPHRDMEIITYMIRGALEHKDSMGNSTVIYPGEVQRMSAGTGIRHSEFNHFKDKESHLLQIWILPEKKNIEPSYGQKNFSQQIESEKLVLVVSQNGRNSSISINQDIELYVSKLKKADSIFLPLDKNRSGWIQLIDGSLEVAGLKLQAGDGLSLQEIVDPEVKANKDSHFLFFNLPKVL